jgi:hypothetical protein
VDGLPRGHFLVDAWPDDGRRVVHHLSDRRVPRRPHQILHPDESHEPVTVGDDDGRQGVVALALEGTSDVPHQVLWCCHGDAGGHVLSRRLEYDLVEFGVLLLRHRHHLAVRARPTEDG